MKKVFLISVCMFFISVTSVFAIRNLATTTTYNSNTLIKTGPGFIYSVSFVATSNGGDFILLDAISDTTDTGAFTDVKAEGSEATADDGDFQDYTKKPLRFRTGLYLKINDGYAIVTYE
ncbi:hypothetical protein LCGC14_2518460 [marine sediment metagenome]|uniref:Uncharacterized protein n=1 Tax=marine sediment metagenome TaxID=412755 RepID=A0A0F9DQF4_9ZZZZ